MHFEDGSPYRYMDATEVDSGTVCATNVGWLEKSNAYEKGTVPARFLEKLFWYCASPVNRTRGLHVCQFCDSKNQPAKGVSAELDGEILTLGSAEIRVQGADGTIFAAPDLIFHYVDVHGYLPPESFIRAVMENDTDSQADPRVAKSSD